MQHLRPARILAAPSGGSFKLPRLRTWACRKSSERSCTSRLPFLIRGHPLCQSTTLACIVGRHRKAAVPSHHEYAIGVPLRRRNPRSPSARSHGYAELPEALKNMMRHDPCYQGWRDARLQRCRPSAPRLRRAHLVFSTRTPPRRTRSRSTASWTPAPPGRRRRCAPSSRSFSGRSSR